MSGGLKGGGGGGRTPSEAPNTLQSLQEVTIVEAISEGPIVGLEKSAQSISLNNCPLQTPEGAFTFKGVRWEERRGLPDQPPFASVSGVESEHSVNVEVTHNFPKGSGSGSGSVSRQVTNTDATHLRVTLAVQALYEQVLKDKKKTGDMIATALKYTITVKNKDGGVVFNQAVEKFDKTNSGAQWAHKITLDGKGPWTVTVTKNTADSMKANIKNDLQWFSYTEIIGYPMTYPNTAVMMLKGTAETFGNNVPSRSYRVKGRILDVPSNYDPVTRKYTGIWDGTFKRAWTDNPAWVFRDMVCNERYGLAKFFPAQYRGWEDMCDKWFLYDIAKICDVMVPDGYGGYEPRYTFNGQITGTGEAKVVLESIASVFHGMVFWASAMLLVRPDFPRDAVRSLTQANVLDGDFVYQTGSNQERHSAVLVTWYDPADYGRPKKELVLDDLLYRQIGYKLLEVTAYGCSSRGQARRHGLWLIETEKEQWQCIVNMGLDSFDLMPGDVVKIADPSLMGTRLSGRLKKIDGRTITLDGPVDLKQGDTYTLSIVMEDGTEETREIETRGQTDELTVKTAFTKVSVESAIWSISGTDVAPRLFAIRSIKEKDKATLELSLREVNRNKFAVIEDGLVLTETPGRRPTPGGLEKPQGLTVIETTYINNNVPLQRLSFSWKATGDPEVVSYEAQIRNPAGSWTVYQPQRFFSVDIAPAAMGEYLFRVRSLAFNGRTSDWVEKTFVAEGTKIKPGAPTNVTAKGGIRSVTVSWTAVNDALIGYYEVLLSETDNFDGTEVKGRILGSSFTVLGLAVGKTYWAWVRSVGLSGDLVSEATGPSSATTDYLKAEDIAEGTIPDSKLNPALKAKIKLLDVDKPLSEIVSSTNDLSSSITMTAAQIRSHKKEIDKAAEAAVQGAVNSDNTYRKHEKEIAYVKTEMNARVTEQGQAIAQLKNELGAAVGENKALIQSTQRVVAGRATLYKQGSAPTGLIIHGDIWVKPDGTIYLWDGNQWLKQQGDDLLKLLETAYAEWKVIMDVNNHVVGFGMTNDGTTAQATFVTDHFFIAAPGGQGQNIFTVDSTTGHVYLNGNLFVRSAGQAGKGWIVGDMIKATTQITISDGGSLIIGDGGKIQVGNGAILIDTEGSPRIVTKDMSRPNGDYSELKEGSLVTYKYLSGAYREMRSLMKMASGTAVSGKRITLPGYWPDYPSIKLSTLNMPVYNPAFSSQQQRVSIEVRDVAWSPVTGIASFTPIATLSIASGSTTFDNNLIPNYRKGLNDKSWGYRNFPVSPFYNRTPHRSIVLNAIKIPPRVSSINLVLAYLTQCYEIRGDGKYVYFSYVNENVHATIDGTKTILRSATAPISSHKLGAQAENPLAWLGYCRSSSHTVSITPSANERTLVLGIDATALSSRAAGFWISDGDAFVGNELRDFGSEYNIIALALSSMTFNFDPGSSAISGTVSWDAIA